MAVQTRAHLPLPRQPPQQQRLKQIEATTGSLDLFGADNIEVQIDRLTRTLWVNVRGRCKLRVFDIRGGYEYIDMLARSDHAVLYERAMANEERISLASRRPSSTTRHARWTAS